LSAFIYSVCLEKELPKTEETTKNIRKAFEEHPHWQSSESDERELRIELYGVLGDVVDDDKASDFVTNLFEMLEKSKEI